MTTIGLPRALYYYQHNAVWESFFRKLGCEVVVSPGTNKEILDEGVKCCSNDTCLPMKVFHGHVNSLLDRVDYVFIPRYTSLMRKEYTCPKFCGLPDMTAHNLNNKVNVLEVSLNLDNGFKETEKSLRILSEKLCLSFSKVKAAFEEISDSLVPGNMGSQEPRDAVSIRCSGIKTVVVLGHHYMLFDSYLNMKLFEKLGKNNINVLTPADLDYHTKRNNAEPYKNREFWEIGLENLGSAYTYMRDEAIAGIIYITPFACGIDSFVIEFIERGMQQYNVPFLKMTIDEHTGEAGFDTRLEAFLDMIV